jgi:alkylated DNA repair dioxygenase AlkB
VESQLKLSLDEPAIQPNRAVPEGATFIADYINSDAELELLNKIDDMQWDDSMSRRVQHYGWRYDYKQRTVEPSDYLGPLPDFLSSLVERVHEQFGLRADQAIINEYQPGQGIAPHIDCEPCFGPVIAMVGLASDAQMDFGCSGVSRSILFQRRGLLVVRGAARHDWTHGIARRRNDKLFGTRRGRRVSVTLRQIIS